MPFAFGPTAWDTVRRDLFRQGSATLAALGPLWLFLCIFLVPRLADTLVIPVSFLALGFLSLNLLAGYTSIGLRLLNHAALALMYMAACLLTHSSGGWGSPGLFLLPVIPVFALGRLTTLGIKVWTGIVLVTIFYIFRLGPNPENKLPPYEASLFMFQVIFSVLGLVINETIGHTMLVEMMLTDLKEQLDKAEDLNRVKSTFLATVSHEMRTPLQGILGHSELLLTNNNLSEDTRENIGIIKRCSLFLLRLITEILDFSKSESGALTIENVPFRIPKLLKMTEKIFLNPKGLDFVVELGPFAAEEVIGDSFKLQQCITNLLSNAEKFTSSGFIRLKCTSERVSDNGDIKLSVYVSDSGIGLDSDQISRLFQPFSQANSSTTRLYGGTGLGLCTTKKYVEMMGGRISCTSVKGQGSTFSFWVLVKEQTNGKAETKPLKASKLSPQAQAHFALVVDDNEMLQQIFKKYLDKLGVQCAIASGGQEAIQLCKKLKFSIIFLDICMPIMNGLDTAVELRKIYGMDFPIIACTGDVFGAGKSPNFTDYLHKPLAIEELKECLEFHPVPQP